MNEDTKSEAEALGLRDSQGSGSDVFLWGAMTRMPHAAPMGENYSIVASQPPSDKSCGACLSIVDSRYIVKLIA